MCGIIGYVGPRACKPLLLDGLERLEYRGYDSAGLALVTNGSVVSVHAVGNLQHLRDAVAAPIRADPQHADRDAQQQRDRGEDRGDLLYDAAHRHASLRLHQP